MTRRPPPRPATHASSHNGLRWRHAWLALGWLASVLLAALLGGAVAWHNTPAAQRAHEFAALETQIGALQQQLANAQRDRQVTDIATRSLRGTLTEREEEIAGLRADLGFYSRLVGADTQREGLKVHDVHLQPLTGSRGWTLSLSLTQNARRDADIRGLVTVSVEGVRDGKVVQLDWPALGASTQEDGVPFRFKYFQSLQATFVLPPGFRPTRLQLHVAPSSDAPVERSIAWADALTSSPPIAPPG